MKPFCHDSIMLMGRMMLSSMFLVAGICKLMHFDMTLAAMILVGLPYANILLVAVIVIELLGGLMIFVGYKARFAAMILFFFLIPVTIFYHDFWLWQGDATVMSMYIVLKNMAIAGGMLYIMASGAGRFSIDGK